MVQGGGATAPRGENHRSWHDRRLRATCVPWDRCGHVAAEERRGASPWDPRVAVGVIWRAYLSIRVAACREKKNGAGAEEGPLLH